MRNALGLTAFLLHLRTALRPYFSLGAGVFLASRNMAFSSAVLPNRAPANKVKAGDEREITQLHSWTEEDVPPGKSILLTSWARRMKGSEIEMCPQGFCDESERWCTCTDAISSVGEETSVVLILERFPCGNWRPCVRVHASRHFLWYVCSTPKGQEKEGCIWRLLGAMNGMRTASRDFAEFLAGILAECMGFYTLKNGTDVFLCMIERDTSCISCRRPAHPCKTCDIGQILGTHCEVGGCQDR